jgi:Sodium/hydrogen exchanger family
MLRTLRSAEDRSSVCLAGIVRDVEGVRHLAELGVVFLLFNIGLELSLERLRSMQKFVFGLGGLQVSCTRDATEPGLPDTCCYQGAEPCS